jgi:hypothetical protein
MNEFLDGILETSSENIFRWAQAKMFYTYTHNFFRKLIEINDSDVK